MGAEESSRPRENHTMPKWVSRLRGIPEFSVVGWWRADSMIISSCFIIQAHRLENVYIIAQCYMARSQVRLNRSAKTHISQSLEWPCNCFHILPLLLQYDSCSVLIIHTCKQMWFPPHLIKLHAHKPSSQMLEIPLMLAQTRQKVFQPHWPPTWNVKDPATAAASPPSASLH